MNSQLAVQGRFSQEQTLSITYTGIFAVGIACMGVAGYFLIEGLSEFSGSAAARRMLIIGGVLFQLTESICFISASALTSHSPVWRYILFALGLVLFSFSIAVMTLAQKTALQSGEAQAQAIDEKRSHLRQQLESLDKVIASYRFNAEKQSKSIYKDSRALGQDSLNRAAELETKKIALSEQLFVLNEKRKQTSSDFFQRFEQVTGLSAQQSEFYFLVIRSLLLELCGIILMSFSANLRAYNRMLARLQAEQARVPAIVSSEPSPQAVEENVSPPQASVVEKATKPSNRQPQTDTPGLAKPVAPVATAPMPASVTNMPSEETGNPVAQASSPPVEPDWEEEEEGRIIHDEKIPNQWKSPKLRKKALKNEAGITDHELEILISMVRDLYEQSLIRGSSAQTIRRALKEHCDKKITNEVSQLLSRIFKSQEQEFG